MEEIQMNEQIKYNILKVLAIVSIVVIILYVYSYGAVKVCNQFDGFLDNKFKCHSDYVPAAKNITQTPLYVPLDSLLNLSLMEVPNEQN